MKNVVVPSVVSLILGIAFLVMGTFFVLEGKRSESWPSVQGVIVKSMVKQKTKEMDRPMSTNTRREISGTSYYPAIEYTYSVAGTQYEGTRIGLMSRGYALRRSANVAVAKYPVGKSVTVFYDASIPSQSVLEPGGTPLLYVLPVLGALFVIAAPIFFF